MATTKVYKNPTAGQSLITTISTGCKTPILPIKFSSMVNAYYYANSPSIPRYSVTCSVDPQLHKEFLKCIQTIEKNEGVATIIKNEVKKSDSEHLNTGNVLIKFQSKDIIPVYLGGTENSDKPEMIKLEDELAAGEQIVVIYDILRYTKKNTMVMEHGISFKPSCIYYYPKDSSDKPKE